MSADSIQEIAGIQDEIQELLSETNNDEEKVGENLQKLEEKIQYLEENAIDAREPKELDSMVEFFIEVCHHLVEDVRTEKEIHKEIEKLKEDEKTYVNLLNRVQNEDLPQDKRQRLQSMIGKIPKGKVETALKEDRRLEKNEETRTKEQIDRLSNVFEDLSHNLKGRRMKSRLEDAREAWMQLTKIEFHA